MKAQTPFLTALEIKHLVKPGTYTVGKPKGLVLRVRQGANGLLKQWALRYMVDGRARSMGLGSHPDVTLEQARKKAETIRTEQIKLRGIDPLAEKSERREAHKHHLNQLALRRTFDQCADQYIEIHRASWKNAKHAAQWINTLHQYVTPVMGSVMIDEISKTHVLDALRPIWEGKNETATRVRGRIEAIWDSAKAQGLCSGDNPAQWKGGLEALLPSISRKRRVKNHPALPYGDIGSFFHNLREQNGMAARALEFLILTATRTNEVIGAQWDEIDLNTKVWVIHASRMKAGKEHRVPLSSQAIDLLKSIGTMDGFVFLSPSGKSLSNMAMLALLKRMGRPDITAHGFRSTFRDWAGECTAHAREVIEHALAHGLKDQTEAAYSRGTSMEKRRVLMQDWGNRCNSTDADMSANVVTMRRAV
jgi:integrase